MMIARHTDDTKARDFLIGSWRYASWRYATGVGAQSGVTPARGGAEAPTIQADRGGSVRPDLPTARDTEIVRESRKRRV
jgi:hypothetical protein